MFVLVRWELIVHDDYPWIIPRWVEITGIPLHLLTIKNLKIIGSKLGHIDTVELSKGRMLIDVDSGKPLVFSKKILSPGGEEMSINVTYNKLFKHCTSCGMMTHELSNGRRRILDRVVRCRDQASLLWFSHPLVHQLDSHCCENRGLKKGMIDISVVIARFTCHRHTYIQQMIDTIDQLIMIARTLLLNCMKGNKGGKEENTNLF